MHVLAWLACGLAAGWLVGFLMRGRGYGPLPDVVLGLLGGLVGGWILHELRGAPEVTGWPAHFLVAVCGGWALALAWKIGRWALERNTR
jgi:uncharacterized membrane protein YeaQ/YmgE (transglycosylase-associated protein family)